MASPNWQFKVTYAGIMSIWLDWCDFPLSQTPLFAFIEIFSSSDLLSLGRAKSPLNFHLLYSSIFINACSAVLWIDVNYLIRLSSRFSTLFNLAQTVYLTSHILPLYYWRIILFDWQSVAFYNYFTYYTTNYSYEIIYNTLTLHRYTQQRYILLCARSLLYSHMNNTMPESQHCWYYSWHP